MKGECAMAQQGLNRVMVLGYLGGTPELKFTNDGKAVARFSVAVNERWKDSEGAPQERVEWIRVVSFGRLAEICGNYLAKGRHVFLEGKLQTGLGGSRGTSPNCHGGDRERSENPRFTE
jgi:single-strand DNA-binding protein